MVQTPAKTSPSEAGSRQRYHHHSADSSSPDFASARRKLRLECVSTLAAAGLEQK